MSVSRRHVLGTLAGGAAALALGTLVAPEEAAAMTPAQIKEVYLPYNSPVSASLPAAATFIGALDAGGFTNVGANPGMTLLFEVPDGLTDITRTFKAFKKGDIIDLDVWTLLGLGWFQRLGTGATTRFAVYEQL